MTTNKKDQENDDALMSLGKGAGDFLFGKENKEQAIVQKTIGNLSYIISKNFILFTQEEISILLNAKGVLKDLIGGK